MISDPTSGEFYSVASGDSQYGPPFQGFVGGIIVKLDYQIVNHERRVYNFFDMISDIGGVYEVIKTVILIFMSSYTSKMYNFYTVNNINHRYINSNRKFQATHNEFLKSVYDRKIIQTSKVHNHDSDGCSQESKKKLNTPNIPETSTKVEKLDQFELLRRKFEIDKSADQIMKPKKNLVQPLNNYESNKNKLGHTIYDNQSSIDRFKFKFSYKML